MIVKISAASKKREAAAHKGLMSGSRSTYLIATTLPPVVTTIMMNAPRVAQSGPACASPCRLTGRQYPSPAQSSEVAAAHLCRSPLIDLILWKLRRGPR